MLALLLEDFKPGFIFRGLFLCRLPADVCPHLQQEDISGPRALSLKADEFYHSLASASVNVLSSEETLDPQIVNAVRGPSSANRGRRSSVSSHQPRLQLQRVVVLLQPFAGIIKLTMRML